MSTIFQYLEIVPKYIIEWIVLVDATGPITSWEIDGETVEKQCQTLFSGAPKSLQMVTAAMKLKDAYSLEGEPT